MGEIMKKDAVYFPHFSNARGDRKIKRVIKELGIEGYGIYFMLLETLREQPELKYPVEDIDLLADEFGTSEQKVLAVVANYKLFEVDQEEEFFSRKLNEYLAPMFAKREQAKKAIEVRWEKNRQKKIEQNQQVNTDVLRENNVSNTNVIQRKQKKTKENKRKENKRKQERELQKPRANKFATPTLEELVSYFSEKKSNHEEAEKFFDHFTSNGWKVGGKTPMRCWKAASRNWIRRSGEKPSSSETEYITDLDADGKVVKILRSEYNAKKHAVN